MLYKFYNLVRSVLVFLFIFVVTTTVLKYSAFSISSKETLKEETLHAVRFYNERFLYDIYWLGIYAGSAALETSLEKDTLRISSRANSSPFISTFYTVEDYAESLVKDGRTVHFRIKQREGRYRSNKETIFDVDKGKIIYFDYLKSKKKEHDLNCIIWDVISGFFYLRTQPLIVGKTVYINVFDSNKFLKAEVSVLRKEKIKVKGVEVSTIVIKPDLKSEGLFHRKGDIFIWLTDNEKKVPVKIETKVPIGKIVAELKNL
ncbi:MAG: DUF3108 domain-containing protein [Thermodesulfovibrionales bacterium]